ncbi:MAG: sensor histidine kinase [Chitinispirillaceae bacterium]
MWTRVILPSVLCVLILILDITTALSFRVWILYIIPLLLSYRSENSRITYSFLVTVGILLALGKLSSPPEGFLSSISVINRILGFIAFTIFTVIINALIASRKHLETFSQELSSANRELEAFSYSLSHDLKNPLSIITMTSNLLIESDEKLSEADRRHHAEEILKNSRKINILIQDMLALSGITRKNLELEEVNLGEMALSIICDFRALHPQRRVDFILQKEMKARADSHLMKIALTNLLENAWKYTSRQPQARIEFGASESQEGLIYYVKDNGAGFDMKESEKLFKPFQRLNPGEFSGTGVGLATVERVIRKHGGRIWAQSRPGEGAVFYFTLGG